MSLALLLECLLFLPSGPVTGCRTTCSVVMCLQAALAHAQALFSTLEQQQQWWRCEARLQALLCSPQWAALSPVGSLSGGGSAAAARGQAMEACVDALSLSQWHL